MEFDGVSRGKISSWLKKEKNTIKYAGEHFLYSVRRE